MSEEVKKRTIAYLCPKCRRSVILERSVFQLAAASAELPCPCGGSSLRVEVEGPYARLSVPCPVCQKNHAVRCSTNDLFHRRAMAFSCSASGLDCCYVGEEQAVFSAVRRLEEAADKLENASGDEGIFLDEIVMQEVLGEIRDIAGRGGVSCECGSSAWRLQVHYSSVELICTDCGGALRIPAATESDIEDICCKSSLRIKRKT